VAEITEDGKKKLIGVGRLIRNIEQRERGVRRPWSPTNGRTRRWAGVLTDYCLDISKKWG